MPAAYHTHHDVSWAFIFIFIFYFQYHQNGARVFFLSSCVDRSVRNATGGTGEKNTMERLHEERDGEHVDSTCQDEARLYKERLRVIYME
jgi:hypothetical protein